MIDKLNEAADDHIRKVVDTAGHPGWDWETQDIADAFIAGANWQAKRSPLPEDTLIFRKGVEEGRRLEREDVLSLIESRLSQIMGDAQPAPILRIELREMINKIK